MLALWSLLADSFVLDCRVTFHFLPVYLPTSIVLLVVGERLKYFVLWLPFLVLKIAFQSSRLTNSLLCPVWIQPARVS